MVHIPIQQLTAAAQPALIKHFLALGSEDRRLRFGLALPDDAIARYVERIDFCHDDVFGMLDDQLELVGVAHLAVSADSAELGLSVSAGHRGIGIGGALFERAHERARNRFVSKMFVHCLAENEAMMRLARKAGMRVVMEFGDADAVVELPPADTASITGEMWQQQVALFDYALKAQAHAIKRFNESLQDEVAADG